MVDAGAVSLLAKDISHIDAPLKRQVKRAVQPSVGGSFQSDVGVAALGK